MLEQRRDMLLLAEGEYSDYQTSPYVVLKPFTMREAFDEFNRSKPPKSDGLYQPGRGPGDFIAFLAARGYVANADIVEVHCGTYGCAELSDDALDMRFEPSTKESV